MCKRPAGTCTELGDDPKKWPTESLLAYPAWFDDQLDLFTDSVRCAVEGDKTRARELLGAVRSEDLKKWYREHGLNSGIIRHGYFKSRAARVRSVVARDRSPTAIVEQTFKRDGYRCRYCGLRVIHKKVLKVFQGILGMDSFPMPKADAERHGVALIFMPSHDHVGPRSCDCLASIRIPPAARAGVGARLAAVGSGTPWRRGPV